MIVKSNLANMQKNIKVLESVKKPFVLKSIEDSKLYLACDEDSCFAYDQNIEKIMTAISNQDGNSQKNLKWGVK